ncbi:ImuA family protein [Dongia soli]|uniref:Protein ImuA n=1 Tax=Dongia soli TaxID=600628 RepID=A0ABU5E9N7_9PROT|nr:hypothetical protein [Dongia soli]MDY0882622.1 hypothetical protein [Dongia soli]
MKADQVTPAIQQNGKIEMLRRQLAQLTSGGTAALRSDQLIPLGLPAVDWHLGGGLPRDALHEVAGSGLDQEQAVLPAFFAATLLRRRTIDGVCLWVASHQDLYGIGLQAYGIDPSDLLLVTTRSDQETLWVMEEAVRAAGIATVIGEIDDLDLTSSRRLQLAAESHGCTVLALRRGRRAETTRRHQAPIAAATRWRIHPLPSFSAAPRPGLGSPCWRLDLWRQRNGPAGSWTITLHEQELHHVEQPARSDPPAVTAGDAIAATSASALPLSLATALGNRSLATPSNPAKNYRATG